MGGGLVTVRRRPSANWGAIGDTVDGVFAEYVAVPFRNAYLIPDHVDDQQAARHWVPISAFPLAAHQARTSHVSERGLLARVLWPFPRYVNSVLFLPRGQIPSAAGTGGARGARPGLRAAGRKVSMWKARSWWTCWNR
jgi:hypothetical protein